MSSEQQHLYLVDGSSYIFRAYHRLPPLTDPQGTPVGAVYGYTTMLWKLAEDLDKAEGPTHLAVILDKDSKSFRNEIYPDYKANRPEPPDDLRPQFPLIRDATRAFSLPCIEESGLEADYLIASYARAAQREVHYSHAVRRHVRGEAVHHLGRATELGVRVHHHHAVLLAVPRRGRRLGAARRLRTLGRVVVTFSFFG